MSKLTNVDELFEGRHFDREMIILCVRWYLRFKLSLRDLVEMIAERGLSLSHMTIMRWVQRYAPEFVKRWNLLRPSHGSILASRRDVCEAARPMGVSLPGRGSGRSDGGLQAERAARSRCGDRKSVV